MDREEVLRKSRQENRGKDIADIETAKAGIRLGWLVTVFMAVIVSLVDAMVNGRMMRQVMLPVWTGLMSVFIFKYREGRKRHELLVACCYGIAAVSCLIGWILLLAGH